jgi:hypothetical protein|tara:strand:+ start:659 stop:778 length:120 start_codon:yes stop_codon:yes gene_type:complete
MELNLKKGLLRDAGAAFFFLERVLEGLNKDLYVFGDLEW